MFIKTGKSLLNNNGLAISIIILILLLIFSYNKCYKNTDMFYSGGASPTTQTTDNTQKTALLEPPSNVRININNNNITIGFTIDITRNAIIPKQFMVVLSQYNSEFINTGHNQLYVSNENEINTNAYSIETQKQKTNLCTLINGIPSCKYTFNNVDITDNNNNIYYYKIGISSVYDNGNSTFITPYNVNTINNLFNLTTTIDFQNNLIADFNTYKATQAKAVGTGGVGSSSNYSDTLSTAEGQYEIITSQLGNYPSNLIMDQQSELQNSLAAYVDKSMAKGILNINVK